MHCPTYNLQQAAIIPESAACSVAPGLANGVFVGRVFARGGPLPFVLAVCVSTLL